MYVRGTTVLMLSGLACAVSPDQGSFVSGETGGVDESESTDGDGDPDGTGTSDDGDDGPLYDVGTIEDVSGGGCEGGGVEFSYLWAAHPGLSAVTKIDTQTLDAVARYPTRPDGAGDPSRTSVSLSGDVAVANRSGGITKIYARVGDCQDQNGTPGIQTSESVDDLLAWGEEECIAWHRPLAYYSNRPVAWTAGELDEETCRRENERVWTSGLPAVSGIVEVLRLDGDDGSIEDQVAIDGLGVVSNPGAYGGAADGEGNFWALVIDNGPGPDTLVRVDGETLDYALQPVPRDGYGMAVDEQGRVFVCGDGVARFDPQTETWATSGPWVSWGSGCMVDGEGRLWMARGIAPSDVRAIDTEVLDVLIEVDIPSYVKGVSIDFDGKVWAVGGTAAVRIDPDTLLIDAVETGANLYTYSDMTGFGLANVSPAG